MWVWSMNGEKPRTATHAGDTLTAPTNITSGSCGCGFVAVSVYRYGQKFPHMCCLNHTMTSHFRINIDIST